MRAVSGSIENLPNLNIVVKRIKEIRSGLISACFGLHDEETFLFAFLDYLQLFFQPTPFDKPLAFLIWQNGICIYSSFRDLYYVNAEQQAHSKLASPESGVLISENHGLWLTIHQITIIKDKSSTDFSNILLTKDSYNYLLEVDLLLNSKDEMFGTRLDDISPRTLSLDYNNFEELLAASIMKKDRGGYPGRRMPKVLADLNYNQQVLPFLESFREVLTELFADLTLQTEKHFKEHKPRLGNIFCVVRTVALPDLRLNSFPFTAGLLLSSNQRQEFCEWCRSCCKKNDNLCPVDLCDERTCLADFEIPLGINSRSAADVTFCSGTIDFGREPGDGIWDLVDQTNIAECRRTKVENCIYPHDASLFFLPVHVNGIPWITLFTFTPSDKKQYWERWFHNYVFYREVTQRAVSQLRWRAEEEYVNQLSKAAFTGEALRDSDLGSVFTLINLQWDIASHVFPLPRFCILIPKDLTAYSLTEPNNWKIKYEENPYFGPPQVSWGRTNPEEIEKKLLICLQAKALEKIAIESKLEKLKYEMREILIRMIRHGFGNWTHSAKVYAESAINHLKRENLSNDIIMEHLKEFSDYFCMGRLTTLGIHNYGVEEQQVTPQILKKIITEQSKFGDAVEVNLNSSTESLMLPGRVVLITAELLTNAMSAKGTKRPISIMMLAEGQLFKMIIRNKCPIPHNEWLLQGRIAGENDFSPDHGLWYCSRLVADVNGNLSLTYDGEAVIATLELSVKHGGINGNG
jgi:hypothetical protein